MYTVSTFRDYATELSGGFTQIKILPYSFGYSLCSFEGHWTYKFLNCLK